MYLLISERYGKSSLDAGMAAVHASEPGEAAKSDEANFLINLAKNVK